MPASLSQSSGLAQTCGKRRRELEPQRFSQERRGWEVLRARKAAWTPQLTTSVRAIELASPSITLVALLCAEANCPTLVDLPIRNQQDEVFPGCGGQPIWSATCVAWRKPMSW